MENNLPLVTVVITTKNEEKNIENCLKSILQQAYPGDKIEMIVVDNNSEDKTKEIARRYTNKVFNEGPERSAQRNFGARRAKGGYYLYLDADMVLSPNVIEECVQKFENCKLPTFGGSAEGGKIENSKLVALYIPEIVTGNSFWSKVRRFERSFYNASVIDCVRFVRMEDFLAVEGFDESMSGPEDWDFDKKIRNRGKVDIIKSVIYHNEGDFKLIPYLRKKRYYIKSFDKYIAKWGRNDVDIKKQLSFYYRFIGVFIEKGEWKKMLRHPVLTLGTYFLRGMVGLNYLINKNKKAIIKKKALITGIDEKKVDR